MGGKEILLNVLWDLRQTVVVQKYRRVYVWLDGVNKPFFFITISCFHMIWQ